MQAICTLKKKRLGRFVKRVTSFSLRSPMLAVPFCTSYGFDAVRYAAAYIQREKMMKNPMRFSAFGRHFTSVLMVTALGGCAGVNFYADPALKNPTGIPIYGSKPYLLVVRTKSEEKPIDVSILYLPDPSKVIYADPRSGFGTAKLTLNLTQGQMTSFGQDIDMKVPELLGAFTGVLTGRATAAKTLAEADQIKAAIPKTAQSSELLDATVLDKIKNLYSDLDGPVFKSELASLDGSQVAIKLGRAHV